MSIPTLAVLLVAQWLPNYCGISPRAEIHVDANTESTVTRGDYTVADIAALARRMGRTTSRTPVGFYSGRFFYKLALSVEDGADGPCRPRLRVDVALNLSDRLIEIGRDIDRSSCEFQKAERHYALKAKADEAVFARYTAKISDGLRNVSIPSIHDGAMTAEEFKRSDTVKASVEASVRFRIDEMLNPFTKDRRDAEDLVDTPKERDALAAPCSLSM